jgi:hypothetical protein
LLQEYGCRYKCLCSEIFLEIHIHVYSRIQVKHRENQNDICFTLLKVHTVVESMPTQVFEEGL